MAAWPSGEHVTGPSIGSALMANSLVDSRCALGEGIIWCERRQAAFWIDIEGRRLWVHVPVTGVTRDWVVPERPTCLALTEGYRLLLGMESGLYLADIDTSSRDALMVQLLTHVEAGNPHVRLNDGRADRAGNFVFGMKDEGSPSGRAGQFYQFSRRHGLRPLALPAAAIANSIAFSPDGTTMYFCDSPSQRILCCDYDPDGAGVANVRMFVQLDDPAAYPDGSTVDASGRLWNAQWGAGRVVCYRPDGGIDQVVTLPVPNVSCCTIGGGRFDRLLVTSARVELTPAALAGAPRSGNVFSVALPALSGQPEPRVNLP